MTVKTFSLLIALLHCLLILPAQAENRATTRFELSGAAGETATLEFAAAPLVAMTVIPFRLELKNADGTPLAVLAGKEYGSGSSRDWAGKGADPLGVGVVIGVVGVSNLLSWLLDRFEKPFTPEGRDRPATSSRRVFPLRGRPRVMGREQALRTRALQARCSLRLALVRRRDGIGL